MKDDFQALQRNITWSLVTLPHGRKSIGCQWVFKIKDKHDGIVKHYKARLVAKGYHQMVGFHFIETFSSIVKPTIIRTVLTITLSPTWSIYQLDINNNFLNGVLYEKVFMDQPPEFKDPKCPHVVRKLHKVFYGLKQAPCVWFEKLTIVLHSFGFI